MKALKNFTWKLTRNLSQQKTALKFVQAKAKEARSCVHQQWSCYRAVHDAKS